MKNNLNQLPVDKFQTETQTIYPGYVEMRDNESSLKNYNLSIVKKISNFLNNKIDILEFGAGIGTLASIWKELNNVKPECLEIDGSSRSALEIRGFVNYSNIKEISKKYDGVYSSNVLEHIEYDLSALKDIHTILKDDGILVIYVPAFMCLFSALDTSVGHYRRYEKNELIEKIKLANFNVFYWSYMDSLGFFASLAVRLFGYKNKSVSLGDSKSMRFYDKYIYPLSSFLDFIGLRFVFGKNILVVAKKY